jgi:hypothetical protein
VNNIVKMKGEGGSNIKLTPFFLFRIQNTKYKMGSIISHSGNILKLNNKIYPILDVKPTYNIVKLKYGFNFKIDRKIDCNKVFSEDRLPKEFLMNIELLKMGIIE